MNKALSIIVFFMGFVVAMGSYSILDTYVFDSYTYGVDKETAVILSLLPILAVAVIASLGYGIGILVFRMSVRHLFSSIFGFIFAVITLAVTRATRTFVSPLMSDDYIIIVFVFLGGFCLAGIIKQFH